MPNSGSGPLEADAEERFRQRTRAARDPTAASDMEALRAYFDSNGDGKLTPADAGFAQFKVLVSNADGSTMVKTLAQLGIAGVNLTEDSTRIELPDGSVIEGQTTFKKADGTTGTVASNALYQNGERWAEPKAFVW